MFLSIISLIKGILFFSGSYSVSVFPDPLNDKEEKECIEQMLLGNKEARNKLIEHNLRLVAHIVKKYETKESSDDLISIGTIGLIKGIDSFKTNKNIKITTYVAKCIENEILMYFRSNKKHNNNVSLNDYIGYDKEGNEINLIDILPLEENNILDELNKKDNINSLSNYLNTLNAREKEIIEKRYGLKNTKSKTQKEIAKELNISRSYVSRIEKRAIGKIYREFLKHNKSFN